MFTIKICLGYCQYNENDNLMNNFIIMCFQEAYSKKMSLIQLASSKQHHHKIVARIINDLLLRFE